MEAVLQTYGLCKGYRRFTALEHVNMTVPKGAIYGLVGKNGAGKTTLIRVICGLQEPTAGDYSLYGARLGDKALHRARRRMGAVVETPSLYPDMTAEQNLKLQYRVLGLPEDKGIEELLELVGLSNTGKKKAGHFSLGMKQRLGIAIALCGDPDFLVLDEPTNGLDPQGIVEMRELILQLNRERQITVLISSHILDELAKLATHYGFFGRGPAGAAGHRPGGGGRLPQVFAGHRHRRPRPVLCAGPAGPALRSGRGQPGGHLPAGERHPAGGGPAKRGLPAPLPQRAGREPGELLYQPGGR